MIVCQWRERRRFPPLKQCFVMFWAVNVSAPYSCVVIHVSYKYEAQQCTSVNNFSQFNCCMQKNILFIARIVVGMIYYIDVIVMRRPMNSV